MPTKKQRDRKRATKPKTKGLNVVPKKKKPTKKPKEQQPTEAEPTDADVPDDAA